MHQRTKVAATFLVGFLHSWTWAAETPAWRSRDVIVPPAVNTQLKLGESLIDAAFESRITKGETADKIDHAATVNTANGKEFRYMKAIPTGDICLACHGGNISDDVKAKLDELYPDENYVTDITDFEEDNCWKKASLFWKT